MGIETTGLVVGMDTTAVKRGMTDLDQLIAKGTLAQQILAGMGTGPAASGLGTLSASIKNLTSAIAGMGTAGNTTNVVLTNVGNTINNIARQANGLKANPFANWKAPSLTGLATAGIAGFSVAGIAKEYIEAADSMQLLDARLKNVTKSQSEFNYAQNAVREISDNTHQSLEATGVLYARISASAQNLGATQGQVKTITQAVADSLRISGSNAQEAAASMLQLSQAFNAGRLQGDEFRSVSENNRRLLQAIADGMDVPIGKLKDLSKQGKLTMDVVAEAIISQQDVLREESEKMGTTVAQAITDVKNSWLELSGDTNKATGATKDLVVQIEDLADYMKSDDFKTAITNAISLVLSFGKAVGDSLNGWAKFQHDVLGSGSPNTDDPTQTQYNDFNDLVSKRQGLLSKQSDLDSAGGLRNALGLGYAAGERAKLQADIDDITKQITDAQNKRKQATIDARSKELFGGVTSSVLDDNDDTPKLHAGYSGAAKKKRTKQPSDRTGTLADQFSTDEYDTGNAALNKYRDSLLKITEAREADLKSGQNQALVQDNVNRAVQGALAIYDRTRQEGLEKYNDETRKLAEDGMPAAIKILDKYTEALDNASQKLASGAIDQNAYNARVAAVGGVYQKAMTDLDEKQDKPTQYMKSAMRNVQSSWADMLYNMESGTDTSFKSILSGWKNLIIKMISEAQAAKLTEALMGKDGTSGLVGIAAKAVGAWLGIGGSSVGSGALGAYTAGGNANLGGYGASTVGDNGTVMAAKGTILRSTQVRMYANGGKDVMGEAGPEGVLPLARGSNGDLGVQIAGGGGSGSPQVNVAVYNTNGSKVSVQQKKNQQGGLDMKVIVAEMQQTMAEDIANGRGPLHDSMTNRFGLDTARNL